MASITDPTTNPIDTITDPNTTNPVNRAIKILVR